MSKKRNLHTPNGFSLIEVLLAGTLFALLTTALVGAYLYGEEATVLALNRARATMLAEEGLEAVRNIRDALYANLIDGTYGLSLASGQWSLVGTPDSTDIFTRQIVIAPAGVNRKSVSVNVTWQQNPQRSGNVSALTRLTNWIAYVTGNWASPIQTASINIPEGDDGDKVQIHGNYAYMTRREEGPNFLVIDVANPASPTIVGSLELSGQPTNIAISGNFAYISNKRDTQELQIIDITIPTNPTFVGSYDAPGSANGNGVYAVGTTAYLLRRDGTDDEFLIIDATNPNSPILVGSLNLGTTGNEVVVSGTNAYIATNHNSQELQVLNIATPSSPTLVGSLNLPGTTDALTIAYAGSTLFFGQGSTFFTISAATPSAPAIIGSIDVSGTLNDIALNLGNTNTYAFLGTSDPANEFKVMNVAIPSTPTLLGEWNVLGTSPLMGVAYSQTLDRAFAASQSDAEEFIVISPQ